MANVNNFVLNGVTIDVEDSTARAEASSATANVATLNQKIEQIEQLSRLTVEYNQNTSTITFNTTTH